MTTPALTPIYVGNLIADINRDKRLALNVKGDSAKVHADRAEHNRQELFTAIRAGLREQYLMRRKLWAEPSGKLSATGRGLGLEFIMGYCSALIALGFPDNLIPTMTAFLAAARDSDDALGLTPTGEPKEPPHAI